MAHGRTNSPARTSRSTRGLRTQISSPAPAVAHDALVAPEHILALFAARDLDALIDAAFHVLCATVVCDFASAFYRSGGSGLLKARDSKGREYGAEFMRRYGELSPAIPLALRSRGIKVLTTARALPRADEDVRRSAFYREIMQPLGWRHSVALCFWSDPPGELPHFVASVDRSEAHDDFSARDLALLGTIHPFIECAVNRLYERAAGNTVRDGMAMAAGDGRGLAILDRNLRVVHANDAARRLCGAWDEDAAAESPQASPLAWVVPMALAAACRVLHQEWQRELRADPDATCGRHDRRVLRSNVPGLIASITMVRPETGDFADPTFVLELERRVHGVPLEAPDPSMPVLQRMTGAERAVALVLADGLSNQEIADRLGKTVDAVKFLLHRIYQKTGVPNRAALVAVLRPRARRSRPPARRR